MIYVILATVHLAVCLLIYLGIQCGVLSVHKYMAIIALLLPFWGTLMVLVLHFQVAFDADDCADIDVEKLKLDSELYRSIVVDEKRSDMTVPIEEALLGFLIGSTLRSVISPRRLSAAATSTRALSINSTSEL